MEAAPTEALLLHSSPVPSDPKGRADSDDDTVSTVCVETPSPPDSDDGVGIEPHPALKGSIRPFNPSLPLANFSPGPAPMPAAVMRQVQAELLDAGGTGLSVMEMSHRSPEFGAVFADTVAVLRRVMELPSSHELLFAHGGGHGQMAAVPLNLCAAGKQCTADYVVNGTWSRRAADEAAKYVTVRHAATSDGTRLPPRDEWDLDPHASYRYICSNETVAGAEFWEMPAFDDDVPLVVDMSSDICSKRVDWARVGVAFACAPKNIGIAGLTVVVVRRSLLESGEAQPICPGVVRRCAAPLVRPRDRGVRVRLGLAPAPDEPYPPPARLPADSVATTGAARLARKLRERRHVEHAGDAQHLDDGQAGALDGGRGRAGRD